jgi:hypothetical protein
MKKLAWLAWLSLWLPSTSVVADPSPQAKAEPVSRILYLYYYPDARHVVEVLRGHSIGEASSSTSTKDDLEQALDEQRADRAASERRAAGYAASSTPSSSSSTVIQSLTGRPAVSSLQEEALAAGLREREAALDRRRFERAAAPVDQLLAPADPTATDPAGQVTISVLGKGMIHLQGPAAGVHRLARMVHEIDRPVGRVKVGLHTIQLELPDSDDIERLHDLVDQHIRHARQLTVRSMELFRQSYDEEVRLRQRPGDHPNCPVGLFCPRFVEEMGRCKHTTGHEAAESLASSLRSLDLLGVLYLTSLAGDDFRRDVWNRFHVAVGQEIVKADSDYFTALFHASQEDRWNRGMYRGSRPECKGVLDPQRLTEASQRDIRFANLERLLRGQECGAGMNSVQQATVSLLEAAQERFEAETLVASLKTDQRLYHQIAWHQQQFGQRGELRPFEEFALAETIDQSESAIVDLDERLRSAVATVDSQLAQLALAMEEDFAAQFYRRAMRHIREASQHWNVRMGQIESTSILTGDRISARVSPGQTVQLDLPNRPILAKEILDGVEVVASETQNVAQRWAVRSAAQGVGPAGSLLADALGATRAGEQLDRLAPPPTNYQVDAGNEVEITPIIQPDGQSISYRLCYPYRTQIASPAGSGEAPRFVKHFIDTQVQSKNYEMQEVSRFRIGIQASRPTRGVPAFEDIPWAGRLFRTRETRSQTVRETMILADAVIYPSILSVTGTHWLIPRAASESMRRDDRQAALQEELIEQSRARIDRLVREQIEGTSRREKEDLASEPSSKEPLAQPIEASWHRSNSNDSIERVSIRSLPTR